MSDASRILRLKYRAWHRGTRESDYILGCFFDRFHHEWGESETGWFEALLDEEDPVVLDWVLGAAPVPERYAGAWFERLRKLDFVTIGG